MPLYAVVSLLTARFSSHSSHTQPRTLAPCKGYGSAKFESTIQDAARTENHYEMKGFGSCIVSYECLIRSVQLEFRTSLGLSSMYPTFVDHNIDITCLLYVESSCR